MVVRATYPSCIVLQMKYNQTCFAVVLNLMRLFHKTVYTVAHKVSRGVSTNASFN